MIWGFNACLYHGAKTDHGLYDMVRTMCLFPVVMNSFHAHSILLEDG